MPIFRPRGWDQPVAEVAHNLSVGPDHQHGTDIDHAREYRGAYYANYQGEYRRLLGGKLSYGLYYPSKSFPPTCPTQMGSRPCYRYATASAMYTPSKSGVKVWNVA